MAKWYHYVGGYYSIPRFVEEAQAQGVTRRVSAKMAKALAYGDTVVLLSWSTGNVTAFAEFRISTLTLQSDIAQEVGEELIRQGKAHYSAGGGHVVRACGSYSVAGTYWVDASVEEIMELAEKAAAEKGVKLSVMVGGSLAKVYDPPVLLQPEPPFTRGFMRCEDDTGYEYAPDGETAMVAIEGYSKRTHKERKDIQLRLPQPA